MMPGPYNILGFLWPILLILWLRIERTPQHLKACVFYVGGLLTILFSGLPFDVTATGSAFFFIRSLIMASVPVSLGMILYVRTFESSPHRIPLLPMVYSTVVMISFVYLINWTILSGFLRWLPIRSIWLALFMESFIRISGLYLAAWACAKVLGREHDTVHPGVVVIYVSVYLFFQGFQSGPSRGTLALFSYSLGAIIVGMWVFKTLPRVGGGLRRITIFLNGLLLVFCSGIQTGLDFFVLAGRSQNLLLFVIILVLIHLGVSKIRQIPETIFTSRTH